MNLEIINTQNIGKIDLESEALFLIDKPTGWTSFDVVNKLRYTLRRITGNKKIKVGHAGTLDPMATGLLLVCSGKATKKIDFLQGMPKTYTGTLKLGATTASYDSEMPEEHFFETAHITPEKIEAVRQKFLGEQAQVPPIFSAIKKDGQPLYKIARQGESVEIEPRQVFIYDFKITNLEMPFVDFEVACSKGTYIRSLAFDFGKSLESGAYLTALRRTKIGDYSVDAAWEINDLCNALENVNQAE